MNETGELTRRLAFGERAVRESGALALRYFRTRLDVVNKAGAGAYDPVTQADREIELLLRERIAQTFPADGIVGEEFGRVAGSSGYDWILDPIDGTRAFVSGHLGWGILAGVLCDGEPSVGLAYQPYTDELFSGTNAAAAFTRGTQRRALETSGLADLADAIVYSTDPAMLRTQEDRRALDRIGNDARMLRFGGDCYSLCLLALGQIDVVVEGHLEPYDILPLVPLIRAAGGVVTDRHGGRDFSGGMVIASAGPELHSQVLARVRSFGGTP